MKYIFPFFCFFLLTMAALAQESKTDQRPPVKTSGGGEQTKIIPVIPVRKADASPAGGPAGANAGATGNMTGVAGDKSGAAASNLTGNTLKTGPAAGPSALSAKEALNLRKQQAAKNATRRPVNVPDPQAIIRQQQDHPQP